MIPLKEHYSNKVIPELKNLMGVSSNMAVPRIIKVTLNMGVGDVLIDKKILEQASEDLALIAGQKASITKVRKSVANFKIRDGMPIGCKVTLRGNRMYDFLQRLLGIAIPRERDFRGLDVGSFDGQGNYSFGVKEHIIFPEVNFDKVDKVRGLDITIVIKSLKSQDSFELLKNFNFPFKNERAN